MNEAAYEESGNTWEGGVICGKRGTFSWDVEWRNVLQPSRFNWCSFHWILFRMEYDKSIPGFRVELALLGVYLSGILQLPWETKQSRELKQTMEEYDLNPDDGFMMIPIDELRKMRLGESASWKFEHAGEKYIVCKDELGFGL